MSALSRASAAKTLDALNAENGNQILGTDRLVPVSAELKPLLGHGLRRGSAISVLGSVSLAFSLLSKATNSGSWCAVVGLPKAGFEASREVGVDLSRLVCVPEPRDKWLEVMATLMDGCDVVLLGARVSPGVSDVRRLGARLRRRGSVLIALGDWPGAEVRLSVQAVQWSGLEKGSGHLRSCDMKVDVTGRGAASLGRSAHLEMTARAS